MSRRRQARELVLGCLYALEAAGQDPKSIFADQAVRQSYDEGTVAYGELVFFKACEQAERIDDVIKAGAAHWEFTRIGSVEKNIMRTAIAELWFCPDTPAPVIIDEAVELAKDYAGTQSGQFVNGLLDWVYKNHPEFNNSPAEVRGMDEEQAEEQ